MKQIRHYEETHKKWINLHEAVRQHEYDIFAKYSKNHDSVLEVGVGDGIISDKLVSDFNKKVFLDIDNSIIENLKIKYKSRNDTEFINSSLFEIINYKNIVKKISNVFMGHTLEHLENPIKDLKQLIKTIDNKKTIYYISVPNALSLHRIAAVDLGMLDDEHDLTDQDKKFGHFRNYDIDSFHNDIKKSGLKIVNYGGILLKPLSNAQMETSFNTELIKTYIKMGNLIPKYAGEIYVIARQEK